MKALLYTVLIIFFVFQIALCDIKMKIGQYDSTYWNGNVLENRLFIGDYEFNNYPKPTQATKVAFSLEVIKENGFSINDWIIKPDYDNASILLLSDSTFIWPGPHKIGDKYTGSIEFIPYASGTYGISLFLDMPNASHRNGIAFGYCLDEDGNLLYLDKWESYPSYNESFPKCSKYSFRAIYFNADSIVLFSRRIGNPDLPFEYNVVVKPIPCVGKTSTIYCDLIANEPISDIGNTIIKMTNANIITTPIPPKAPLDINEKVRIIYDFSPILHPGVHVINMVQQCWSRTMNRIIDYHIDFSLLFDDSGKLLYCSNTGIEIPPHIMQKYSLEELKTAARSIKTITEDGQVIDGIITDSGKIIKE